MIGVDEGFHKLAFGQVIAPLVRLYMSFDKKLQMGKFFTLNSSQLNGADILKASSVDVPAQNWDFYNYRDFSDRLVNANWERRLDFPYQIQAGLGDFTVDNTDGYFTPLNPKSTIGKDNLPARPFRLYAGYNGNPQILPQMVGITDGMPDVNNGSRTVDYHGIDFLYHICNHTLRNIVDMRDVTTDQVIAAILEDYGLAPSQYQLAKGRYKVPFVFFDIGEDAGSALKQLVQSENGYMWLDEKGIVRFETVSSINGQIGISAHLTDYDIISLEAGGLDNIVNHMRVQAEIREVQEWQEVYTKSSSLEDVSTSLWVVRPGDTYEISCNLSDPCYDIVAPKQGRAADVSWFTAIDQNGNTVSTGVTATGRLTSNAYIITFKNSNSFAIEIDEMKLWGEPAKVYDVIDYDAYDDESLEKYGDQLLEISDNRFFQTYYQADAFARSIIAQRKEYGRVVEAQIKGDFSFQLMDQIEIETQAGEYDGIYRILGISYSWNGKTLITKLTLNGGDEITPGEFTLNVSQLNGEDLIQ